MQLMKWMAFVLIPAAAVLGAAGQDPVTTGNPSADPSAVVVSGNARFTILTPQLIRMEYAPDGQFEDRASFAFINRRLPVPKFRITRRGGGLKIHTRALKLLYREDTGRPFDDENLMITWRMGQRNMSWRPGFAESANLGGTYRTLDGISGGTAIPPGLLSREGWVLVDDSTRHVFDRVVGTNRPWIADRGRKSQDWYFFGYGHDYTAALRDFTRVAGRIPLPPRFAFGTWWSRYWAYSDAELRELVAGFQEHDVPLDVLVVDMDWHKAGWTGYSWNPEYFPDPEGFMRWVHEQGLQLTLNLHPADGVGRHERAFADVARHMGLDPQAIERVPFDCTDPRYVQAYFEHLHHPLERQGVDFWWIDWQQGTGLAHGKLPSVDPLPWLNHLHWVDMLHNPQRGDLRPLQFSRWGKLGCHRYQVGFSGDTYCNWKSLAFQPQFTATAGNVAYPFWSHDIGGHMPGPVEPELYTRWVQWGVFSPILRTHTTKNPDAERRIWKFPDEHFRVMRDAFKQRYALIPYIYSAARQAYEEALPLCRPMYYEWPELDAAYTHVDQYMFGDDLLVAPVLQPADKLSGWATVDVWIPPGQWHAWYTGRMFQGPREISMLVPLDEIPVFARSGAVVPMQPDMRYTAEKPVNPLILHIWPGISGETRVYEDDGVSLGYQSAACAWTPVSHEVVAGNRLVRIGAVEGSYPGMPDTRQYEVHLREIGPVEAVLIDGTPVAQAQGKADGWHYDPQDLRLELHLASRPTNQVIHVSVQTREDEAAQQQLARARRTRASQRVYGDGIELPAGATMAELAEYVLDRTSTPFTPEDKQRRLARTLGLTTKLDIIGRDGSETGVDLSVTLGSWPPVDVGHEFPCALTWDAGPGATLTNGSTGDYLQVQPETSYTLRRSIRLNGPQTCVVRVDITPQIDFSGATLTIPLEAVLLPSINDWQIIGPFPVAYEDAFATVFRPEESVQLGVPCTVAGQPLHWKRLTRSLETGPALTTEFMIDFQRVLDGNHHEHAVAYAYTVLHAPEALDAVLALGSDDGIVAWLNGREVHRFSEPRGYTPKQDRVPVHLNAGPNPLLIKVAQQAGGWQFSAYLETPEGKPLPQVRVAPDAPEKTDR